MSEKAYSKQFEKYLDHEKPFKSSDVPAINETVAHLKLLRAFVVLKETITIGFRSRIEQEKVWQSYVTVAVRNFIILVSSLRKKFEKESDFIDFMDHTLPSLDIILVWHSFLLNPGDFYDCFLINDFELFIQYSFPLFRISKAITNDSFMYEPDQNGQDRFAQLMNSFSDKSNYSYNAYRYFNAYEVRLPVYCPICHKHLGMHSLTTHDKTGIADNRFEMISRTNCQCGFDEFVDKDNLRRRKLISDSTRVIPSVHKNFSSVFHEESVIKDVNIESVNRKIKTFVETIHGQSKYTSLAGLINQELDRYSVLVLRDYFEVNPISLTVPVSETITIHSDLVGCVARQERFITKMEDLKWLFSPYIELTITEAIERYKKYFQLMKITNQSPLVPTLDIDLIWHTHQLGAQRYHKYSKMILGYVLDHNDKIEENRLNHGFTKTCKVYKTEFKQDYSICLCWYCTWQRNSSKAIFQRSNTKVPLIKNPRSTTSIGHISCHNAVKINTSKAKTAASKFSKKHKLSEDQILPWDDDQIFSSHYVNDPKTPVTASDSHLKLYHNKDWSMDLCSACGSSTTSSDVTSNYGSNSGSSSCSGGVGM